jgi:hypothetical protein
MTLIKDYLIQGSLEVPPTQIWKYTDWGCERNKFIGQYRVQVLGYPNYDARSFVVCRYQDTGEINEVNLFSLFPEV